MSKKDVLKLLGDIEFKIIIKNYIYFIYDNYDKIIFLSFENDGYVKIYKSDLLPVLWSDDYDDIIDYLKTMFKIELRKFKVKKILNEN